VRRILGELPETLDDTYERVLREIHKANREHALRLLQCLVVAVRPLRAEELAEVLAVDFDAARQNGIPRLNPDWRWEDQHKAVLSTCSSLVVIVEEDGSEVVQFSHFSVKEFLTSERLAISCGDISRYHIAFEPAHMILAQACLGVLLRLDNHVDETDASNTPLIGYAARYWVDHALFENVSSRIRDAMELLFDADKPHWAAWLRVHDMDKSWTWFEYSHQTRGGPLYYASLYGLFDLAEQLVVKHPQHVNAEGGRMKTALVATLYKKHFWVAELLHQHGADVNVRDDETRTLLYSASGDGLVDIAQWLINHGADVNAQREDTLGAPVQIASSWGRSKVVRILLEHQANINTRDQDRETALHFASYATSHRDDIIRLLLEYGVEVNARNNEGSTALHILFSRGLEPSVEAVRLQLKYGANMDAENNEGQTAIQLASTDMRHKIMELLTELEAK
jgi:ankyrin repeat protein